MAEIPGGCFQMGSPPSEQGRHGYERRHKVCVRPFRLMTHEVTNAQYRRFRPGHDSGAYRGLSLNGDRHPAVRVSWDEAAAYARWLRAVTGRPYRLPTEAEWEYAARAGTTTARPWETNSGAACRYANAADRSAKAVFADWDIAIHDCEDGHATTAPAQSYRPNDWGLYNMLGNVWEWVCSGFHANYDNGGESECGAVGPGGLRGARGGAWFNVPDRVRSAARTGKPWDTRAVGLGFRLAEEIAG